MFPEAGSLFAFIVTVGGKAFLQELVGQYTGLGKAPNSALHFQVYVSVVHPVDKVIMLGNPRGGKGKRDAHVFVSIKGGQKVEVFMSRHIYLVSSVLSMLFQCNFAVVMSAILVVSSPG